MLRWLTILALLWPWTARAELADVTLPQGRYLIAVPDGVAAPPLLIALHGGGGNPAQFARVSGLEEAALVAGWAVAFPGGHSRGGPLLTWNGGYCCGAAAAEGVDHLAWLDLVAADAVRRFGLDPGRIAVTGMSNGAIMAETWAAGRPDALCAVAAVAGTMDIRAIGVGPRVPLLAIHGTEDGHVPYRGGIGPDSPTGTDFAAVEDVVARFAAAWGPLAWSETVIDPARDGHHVIRRDGTTPEGGLAVRLLTVAGGGHVWPGGSRDRGPGRVRDIDATDEVMAFVRASCG